MYITDSLPNTLRTWLTMHLSSKGYVFMTEFPNMYKQVPLRVPTIVIGVKSSEIKQKKDENGENVPGVKEMTAALDITIHMPVRQGGMTCHKIFSEIADLLLFNTNLDIVEIGSGKIKYMRITESLRMPGFVKIKADITADPEKEYTSPLLL
ncbi:MAG TPA: hypothetical protein PKO20_00390 [Clostridiales bacterium]|nr:hypothetical protein [Clostridiales bacterium]HOJ35651.1 hypothetical protein [Clostridiales bacterium]HOL78821.1 hypothetical protein [Clostridiales bacterium]HPP67695.1 hypothetical protein [Clostridiales bacterium]HPU66547.1 hypothetical protein [Clostridiales bacterium]